MFYPPKTVSNKISKAKQSFQPDSSPLPGLTSIGSTIDWWTGEFKPRVVKWNENMKNYYQILQKGMKYKVPDEILIVDTYYLEQEAKSEVQTNSLEYMNMRQKTFGLGVGFSGMISLGGSVSAGNANQIFSSSSIRTAETSIHSTYYQLSLLPPEYLSLEDEVILVFNGLPRYDSSTKDLWFQQFKNYGSHVITSLTTGGEAWMRHIINVEGLGVSTNAWISAQATISFMFMTASTPEKRQEWALKLDPSFVTHQKQEFSYKGGKTDLGPNDQNEWIKTLPDNLVPLRYKTVSLADFFPEGPLKEDLKVATNDYLLSFKPVNPKEFFLGPEKLYPNLPSSNIAVSSKYQHCYDSCSFWKCSWKCNPFENPLRIIDGSSSSFYFIGGDSNQQATITLPEFLYISTIKAQIGRPGTLDTSTSAFAQAPLGGSIWGSYNMQNNPIPQSGLLEYKKQFPIRANQILFNFGPALRPAIRGNNKGTLVNMVQVFSISDSTPIAWIENIKPNKISGWAFDPIDTAKVLAVTVYADNKIVAIGTTGIQRPDINSNYHLPDGSNPGFEISLSIPKESGHSYQIYATFQGLTQTIASSNFNLWSPQPPGHLLEAFPSYVTGWAYSLEYPQDVYDIEILVDNVLVAQSKTGLHEPVTKIIFGKEGNYGFKIPLAIKTIGSHNVRAQVKLANGVILPIPDVLNVELNFPKGLIFDLKPSYITGFAYDPYHPDQATTVLVYLDGDLITQGQTTLLLPEYNDQYLISGNHGFNISMRMMGGKIHYVDVYVLINGQNKQFIDSKSISIGLPHDSENILTNGIINYAGVGYDPCTGEWRLRVIDLNFENKKVVNDALWKGSNIYGLQYPDEIELQTRTSDIFTNYTQIFASIEEWSKYSSESWKSGFNLGFFSFSKSYSKSVYEKQFTSKLSRFALSKRLINLATISLLPPELLKFSNPAKGLFENLPEYNTVTRPKYFKFFDLFGVTYPSLFSLGGKMEFNMFYDTTNTSAENMVWEKQQTSFSFTYYVTLSASFENQNAQKYLNKNFFESSKKSIRFVGGHPENFEPENSQLWSATIKSNLAIVDMQLTSISELVTDPQKKDWLSQAIKDYMLVCTPERWLCNDFNVALASQGASIIQISSKQSDEPFEATRNIIEPPELTSPWGPQHETSFIFSDHDSNQWVILDLGQSIPIKRISVQVDTLPSLYAMRNFIKVEISTDNINFRVWGILDSINQSMNHFPILSPINLKYIKVSFGPTQPNTGLGGRLIKLMAYTCV